MKKRERPSADEAELTERAVESTNKRVTGVLPAEMATKKRRKEQAVFSDKIIHVSITGSVSILKPMNISLMVPIQ